MPKISHEDLIDFSQKIGYPASDEGLCNGFTMRWIEAVMTGKTEKFDERLSAISSMKSKLDGGVKLEELSLDVEDVIDVRAFFESLLIYQESRISSDILEEPISQNDIEKTSAIASSMAMEELGGFKNTATIYFGHFEEQDIRSCLGRLQTKIEESGELELIAVPFLCTLMDKAGDLHAVAMIFYPKEKTWQFMDVNSYPPQKPSNIDGMMEALPLSSYQDFTLQVLLPNKEHVLTLEKSLAQIPAIPTKLNNPTNLLFFAAENGHVGAVQSLLSQGVGPNIPNSTGETPLYIAAQKGYLEVVKLLLDHGAGPNIPSSYGMTPLYIALQQGHPGMVELLLAKGADPNIPSSKGIIPLCIAAQKGYLEVVELLLAKDADPDIPSSNGLTPLYIAALQEHPGMVELLLAKGADPDIPSSNGMTPLYIAALQGHPGMVELLLAKDADPNIPSSTGATPLYIAAQNRHLGIAELLLAKGAGPNISSSTGATPLCIAAQKGYLEVVELLLAKGADPNISSSDGKTPLCIAAQKGYLEVVELLLAKGARPNIPSSNGMTPLYIAAKKGYLEVGRLLLAKGADPNISSSDGKTPLYIALQQGPPGMVELLLAKGEKLDKSEGTVQQTMPALPSVCRKLQSAINYLDPGLFNSATREILKESIKELERKHGTNSNEENPQPSTLKR